MQKARPVPNDLDRLADMGVRLVGRDLLEEGEKVRHDPAVAAAIVGAVHPTEAP